MSPPTDDARALRRLASRLLRPDAARTAEVSAWSTEFLASVAPHTPSARLWSALAAAGYIPRDWAGDRARRFDAARDVDLAWPPDVATAVALASDPHGVATVEALLRGHWRALAPDASVSPTVRWRVMPRERVQPGRERPGRALIVEALCPRDPIDDGLARLFGVARDIVEGVFGERRATLEPAERLSLPGVDPTATFDGAAFEEALGADVTPAAADALAHDLGCARRWALLRPDAPNPFAALRRVWELGYAVDEVTPEGFVVLAPEASTRAPAPWSRSVRVTASEGALPPHTLSPGLPVRLERDAAHPRDPRAVRVVTDDRRLVGYVPRALAATLSQHLDNGLAHRAELARVEASAAPHEHAVYVAITEG
jgi:hypothetical protein